MTRRRWLLPALLAATATGAGPAGARVADDPLRLVDPFVGTEGDHGQLTPAAGGPHGMVSLVADTVPAQHNGYDHAARTLVGFSHTRAHGVGCAGGGGDLLVSVGYAGEGPQWAMDKASERASPGRYHVRYGSGIDADLAAVGAGGLSRFTLPRPGTVRIVLDPRHGYTKRLSASWESRAPGDLAGSMSAGTVCDRGVYHLSFAARLTRNGRAITTPPVDLPGDRLAFDVVVDAGDRIALATGLSVVDPASARRVRDGIVGDRTIDTLARTAAREWRWELRRIAVPGTDDRARRFYTALFHALQTPVRIDDLDGRYRRSDGSLHTAPRGHHRYAGWAVWDNYRTQLPLLALLDPPRAGDVADSLAELYLAGKVGWATRHEPFVTVRTEHAGVALLDFRRKGLGSFDAARILPLMIAELPGLPNETPDQQIETAYDSWAAAELARDLGRTAEAARLRERALSYRAMWTRVFRDVAPDFDTVKARGLYQGTLWQYRWAPVFDLDWLINRGLGRARFNAELTRFFADGLFNMTNQPDIQAPWLFTRSGAPGRTRALVDHYLHQPVNHWYTNAGKRPAPWHGESFARSPRGFADGMDDDEGGMSSWYVWGSIGLYPLVPGEPFYAVTAPSFGRVTVRPHGGRTIRLRADATAAPCAIRWNGRTLIDARLPDRAVRGGGTLLVAQRCGEAS